MFQYISKEMNVASGRTLKRTNVTLTSVGCYFCFNITSLDTNIKHFKQIFQMKFLRKLYRNILWGFSLPFPDGCCSDWRELQKNLNVKINPSSAVLKPQLCFHIPTKLQNSACVNISSSFCVDLGLSHSGI